MIVIENLVRQHGAREVFHGVGLEAHSGHATGFMGPNGIGESSTLRCLLGLDRVDGGQAPVDERTYRELHGPLCVVGAVLDDLGAYPSRMARSHLGRMTSGAGVGRRRVTETLDVVGLSEATGRQVCTFSLGVGQRLGLMTVPLGDPEVLVLDEPVNSLDPEGIRWTYRLPRQRADAGGMILLSGHVPAKLVEVISDVVVTTGERVRTAGTLEEVAVGYASPEEAFFSLTISAGDAAGSRAGRAGRIRRADRASRAERENGGRL